MDTGKATPKMRPELRPVLREFAEAMEIRLRQNDDKDGWGEKQCSIEYLERCLVQEFAEYMGDKACETGNNPEGEAVDIANFAMMLWSRWVRKDNIHIKPNKL